jgi:uncharacterized membrane protein YgcG
MTPRHRPSATRSLLALIAAVLLAVGFAGGSVRPAAAASGDAITSYAIDYDLEASGVLKVKETIAYTFGASGRHGIDRNLVTREPDPDNPGMDQVYTVDDIEVSSPTGAPHQWTRSDSDAQDGREVTTRIRIGDPNEELTDSSETYVISYDVVGSMRSFSGYDELYWDATGLGWEATIDQLKITAKVPGGAEGVTCTTGPPKSTTKCAEATPGGAAATFTQANIPEGSGVTIGVKIGVGLVSDNKPHLEPDASKATPAERAAYVGGGVAGGLIAILSPLFGVLWWRRKGRDQRYVGLPPGTVPYAGQTAEIGYDSKDIQVPVAFSPPKIPVAEAGVLVDGQVDPRETAATIIDLAVRGALTVQSYEDKKYQVTLVDPNRAQAPHEMTLMTKLFAGEPPGATADLSARGSIIAAHQAMVDQVRKQVDARGWFRKVPPSKANGFGFGGVIFVSFILFWINHSLWWLALLLLPITITIAVVRHKLRRGQRTADGRAMCDQVDGFKLYLSTAEADQLRFEEGEDIFSRYLPWAIAFDLADRWAKICGDLVAAGRIPDTTPYWYAGNNFNLMAFNIGYLTSGLTTAATPAPASSGGGTGFGSGGSSFSGGGFSGGGGGGGGGGSW